MRRFVLTAAFVCALVVPAAAADYTVDPGHTQAAFTVTHLAISHVRGQIPLASGTMAVDAEGLPTAVDVVLDVKRIETQNPDRDRELRSPTWFDVEKYPQMTFVAKKSSGTPRAFTVTGELTFHGVSKPVTLTAKEEGRIVDGRGRTHIGYAATTTIDRRDWGLTWGGAAPGGALIAAYEATIELNVEVVSR